MEADRERDRADGRVHRAVMASAATATLRWPDSSSPLSALDSASPSDPHATKLAPSPASHYSVESLIRTSGQACCMRKTVRLLLGTTLNSMHVATQGE